MNEKELIGKIHSSMYHQLHLLVNPLSSLDALTLLWDNHLLRVNCLLWCLSLLRHAVIFIIYHSGFLPLSSRHFLFLLQLLFTAIYLY